jgi:hypothetical protein
MYDRIFAEDGESRKLVVFSTKTPRFKRDFRLFHRLATSPEKSRV